MWLLMNCFFFLTLLSMINLEELWVGDGVKIVSSGRIGTFEGIHQNGKARIKSQGKIYLASAVNLELYEIKTNAPQVFFSEEKPKTKQSFIEFSDSIDLHIEKLKPSLENGLPERIVDIQVKAFMNYLDSARTLNKSLVVIIHGKGAGVLKQIVQSTLKGDSKVFSFRDINNGGATEVVFNPY